jgi:hypothetical protein
MKKYLTPPFWGFVAAAFVIAVGFHFCHSAAVRAHSMGYVELSGIGYFGLMFAAGWFFGVRDAKYLPIYDIGFRWHLATFIVTYAVAQMWFAVGLNAPQESLKAIEENIIRLIWAIVLIIHFVVYLVLRRRSIRGLSKKELFS